MIVEGVSLHPQPTSQQLATSPPHNPSDVSLSLDSSKPAQLQSTSSSIMPNLPLSPPTEPSLTPSLLESSESVDERLGSSELFDAGVEMIGVAKAEVVEEEVQMMVVADQKEMVMADDLQQQPLGFMEIAAAAAVTTTDEVQVVEVEMEEEVVMQDVVQDSSCPAPVSASAPLTSPVAPLAAVAAPAAVPAVLAALTAADIKGCKSVLSSLQRHNAAWPFKLPVDPVTACAPDYHIIIKNPMDLSTISQKLNQGQYTHLMAFVDDCKLIFDNCYLYNPPTHLVHQQGRQLEKYFSNLLNRTFPLLPVYNRNQNDAASVAAAPVKKAPAARASTSTSQKRKRGKSSVDAVIASAPATLASSDMMDLTKPGHLNVTGLPGGELTANMVMSPVTAAAPVEVIRSSRERKPKKFYEPEDVRRGSDEFDANGMKRRRSSSGKAGSSGKKKKEDEIQATLMSALGMLETVKGGKHKKKDVKNLMASVTMAAMAGILNKISNDSSSDDSSSDDEGASRKVAASSGSRRSSGSAAPRKRSKSSKSDVPRVGKVSGGPIVEDLEGGLMSNDVGSAKRCDFCATVSTSQWRRGPNGKHTLCNKCGISWKEGEKKKSVRVISFEEKMQLRDMIGSLSERHLAGVVDVIRQGMPGLAAAGEIELDIDSLDATTLVKLYDHVKGCVEEDRKQAEKARAAARKAASNLRKDREGIQESDSDSDSGSDSGSDSD
ncbi:hypothetical protein HDU97_006191 [Phlyctochytrium planicorne]|nr:hypothetical protein HDU97_006191 [Phlyctochytrium planicorne]